MAACLRLREDPERARRAAHTRSSRPHVVDTSFFVSKTEFGFATRPPRSPSRPKARDPDLCFSMLQSRCRWYAAEAVLAGGYGANSVDGSVA
jgi:hypothetical protein